MKLLVYVGPFRVVRTPLLDQEVERGVPVPVSDSVAERLLQSRSWEEHKPKKAPKSKPVEPETLPLADLLVVEDPIADSEITD